MRSFLLVVLLVLFSFMPMALGQPAVDRPFDRAYNDAGEQSAALQSFLTQLWVYVTAAREDLSLCKDDDCAQAVQEVLNFRYMGEGRCSECKESAREACNFFKAGDCASIKDVIKRDYCNILMSGSVEQMKELSKEWGPEADMQDLAATFGIISGYRSHNDKDCSKYVLNFIGSDRPSFYSCDILFSPDPQASYNRLAAAAQLLDRAGSENDPALCDQIRDLGFSQRCRRLPFQSRADSSVHDEEQ